MSRCSKISTSTRPPIGEKRAESARIPLTPGEKGELLDAAGDEDLATWAREILLGVARNIADRRRWLERLGAVRPDLRLPIHTLPHARRTLAEYAYAWRSGHIRDDDYTALIGRIYERWPALLTEAAP